MKPVPVPDAVTGRYWSAAASGVLAVHRCQQCSFYSHPPALVCRGCRSADLEFTSVSGRGRIRAWTVMRTSFVPGFDDELPLVIVDVELDEQPELRMVAGLLDGNVDGVRLGARVEVVFPPARDGIVVPQFQLSEIGE